MPKKTSLIAITLTATALLGAAAIAQTQSPAPSQLATPDDPPGRTGPRGPGMGGEFGRGGMMGQGGMRGPWGPGMRQGTPGFSDADRAAFFEARLASIKAGLTLSESQLKFWPAVESSMREMSKQRQELAERLRKEGQPANPADRMKRTGEIMSARGATMTKMAEAMKPLYDSLTDDQKRRLQVLMRGQMARGGQQGMMDRHHRSGYRESMGGGERPQWYRGEGRRWNQDWPGHGGDSRSEWRRL